MKYIFTSDQHMAHVNTPTLHIINVFNKEILEERIKGKDVLFLGGDLFDIGISVSTENNMNITKFMGHMLDRCYEEGVKLRVLKGTPFHDKDQLKMLVVLNNLRKNKVDLKYYDYLEIEHIKDLNKYVLYIPDEWCKKHSVVEKQIEEKLKEHSIKQVDVAIMHGMFNYQMLGIPHSSFTYDESYFLKLVKGFIHIGHVHSYSSFERIHGGPSLDRLRHGEEDPKGFTMINGTEIEFIENKNAYIYKTIRITKNTTIEQLDKRILKYPKGSFIRFNFSKDNALNAMFKELTIRYSEYNLTKLISEEGEVPSNSLLDMSNFTLTDFDGLTTNLVETVRERILNKHTFKESAIIKLDKYLKPFEGSENKGELYE